MSYENEIKALREKEAAIDAQLKAQEQKSAGLKNQPDKLDELKNIDGQNASLRASLDEIRKEIKSLEGRGKIDEIPKTIIEKNERWKEVGEYTKHIEESLLEKTHKEVSIPDKVESIHGLSADPVALAAIATAGMLSVAAHKAPEYKDAIAEKLADFKETVTDKFNDVRDSLKDKFSQEKEPVKEPDPYALKNQIQENNGRSIADSKNEIANIIDDKRKEMFQRQEKEFSKLSLDQYAQIKANNEQTPEMAAKFVEQHQALKKMHDKEIKSFDNWQAATDKWQNEIQNNETVLRTKHEASTAASEKSVQVQESRLTETKKEGYEKTIDELKANAKENEKTQNKEFEKKMDDIPKQQAALQYAVETTKNRDVEERAKEIERQRELERQRQLELQGRNGR